MAPKWMITYYYRSRI